MDPDAVTEALHRHIRAMWPDGLERFWWDLGEFPTDYPRWRVFCAAPRGERRYWVYVSAGAWEADVSGGGAHEFILHSPVEERLHIEKLAALTRRQADPSVAGLVVGAVLPLGEPWLEGSPLDHLYVANAVSYPEEFEYLHVGGLTIHFLWLIPAYEQEARLIEDEGGEAFEALLGSTGVDLVDPQRPSVA